MPDADITLTRVDVVGAMGAGPQQASLVWTDVIGTAWLSARPIARYVAFMLVAGVIGCYGVLDNNSILIVGAMAVAPTSSRSPRSPWPSSDARPGWRAVPS